MDIHSGLSLLVNGTEAFPELLRCIDGAKSSCEIHMFIWRADHIGVRMAEAVLRAADRGVQVRICVDRYALLLEKCEESGRSFFHEPPTLMERVKILGLRAAYREPVRSCGEEARCTALLEAMLGHENIRISRQEVLADHSKYYVIDEEILFLGGINIEDKENGRDLSGRAYYDYMVKLTGREAVAAFRDKTERGIDRPGPVRFAVNSRQLSPARFEMREEYLSVIREAREELWITMGYFGLTEEFSEAILAAVRRGVRVSVVTAEKANFQNRSNHRTLRLLLEKSGGGVSVFLSPRMVHAKVVCSESRICLGSCNITRRAFRQLCELNLTVANANTPFCRRLLAHMEEERRLARQVTDPAAFRGGKLLGWLESFGT